MQFITVNPQTGEKKIFNYDNITGVVSFEHSPITPSKTPPGKYRVSETEPIIGKRRLTRIKIQMGLKCNFSCTYCLQKDIVYDDTNAKSEVDNFLEKMETWFDGGQYGDGGGVSIETWGGEPFVYWKTMKPLVEGLKARWPALRFSVISNGSLLTKEKIDWLVEHNFGLSISHDGPGQAIRGDDPIADPEMLDVWKYALVKLKGRISINPVLASKDASRKEITDWFAERLGPGLRHGEGSFINAHNADSTGIAESLTPEEYQQFAHKSFLEIREHGFDQWSIVRMKVQGFINASNAKKSILTANSKCGMDNPNSVTVDLRGNVLTCQNTSAEDIAGNGKSHKIGHVDNLAGVRLDTSTHFSHRENCMKCPVLQLCRGNCMMTHGDMFDAGCQASYFDSIPMLAAGLEKMTGQLLVGIEGVEGLPNSRKDPFGLMKLDTSEESRPKKKYKTFELKSSNATSKLCGLS